MGSAAAEEIMVKQLASLLEAEHAGAAITTDLFGFPQNNNSSFPVIEQSQLKPFFISTDPPNNHHYYFSHHQQHQQQQQQQQQSLLFSLKPSSSDLLHFPPSSFPSTSAATHLLSSLHRSSSSSLWEVGESFVRGRNGVGDGGEEDEDRKPPRLRVSTTTTMKRLKGRKKVREPRFSFKTMSDVDVLDDGYKWRKYGQKVVKNTLHPRSYYRCTQDNCRVKKRVERLAEDPRMVITTYEGRHAHSPSLDNLEETMGMLPSSHLNNFFW